MHLLITLLIVGQAAQAPSTGSGQVLPAIGAAKAASAQVTEAQKKNSEALEQKPAPAPTPGPAQPAPAAPAQPASAGAAQGAAGTTPEAPASTGSGQAAPQGVYSYDAQGRRDPFVNLLLRGGDTRPAGATRPPGLPGLLIAEISVKGVLKAKGAFVAILQASDSKTYIAHSGDKVMDGSVKSIAQDAVVFSQDVNDPLSLVKQREVRKSIRPETR